VVVEPVPAPKQILEEEKEEEEEEEEEEQEKEKGEESEGGEEGQEDVEEGHILEMILRTLELSLKCPQCENALEDARILDCGHSYCNHCSKESIGGKEITCHCKGKTVKSNMRCNYLLRWAIAKEAFKETAVPNCCNCENPALYFCAECSREGDFLCEEHNNEIHQWKNKRFHSVVTAKSQCQKLNYSCAQHPKNQLDMWCEEDKTPMCMSCIQKTNHKKHSTDKHFIMEEARASADEDLQRIMMSAGDTLEVVNKQTDTLTEAIAELDKVHESKLAEIQKQFQALVELVQGKRDSQLKLFTETVTKKKTTMEKELKYWEVKANHLQSSLGTARKVIDAPGDAEFFVLVEPVMRKLNNDTQELLGETTKREKAFLSLNVDWISRPSDLYSAVAGITLNVNIQNLKSEQGIVRTLAGNGTEGYQDGPRDKAMFSDPSGLVIDQEGYLIVADRDNHTIRRVSPLGEVSTLAGNGKKGYREGKGTEAIFDGPTGVAIDFMGNIFVADSNNYRVRIILPNGFTETFAGVGESGFADGKCMEAKFADLEGITITVDRTVYVIDGHMIRRISPEGNLSTLAGGKEKGNADGIGARARFHHPTGLAVGPDNRIYVADCMNQTVRVITPEGVVETLAGNGTAGFEDGEKGTFNNPLAVALDKDNNVYVADFVNNRIRKVTQTGVVTTVAGNANNGSADGIGEQATFRGPSGLALNEEGDIFVADGFNHKIRKIAQKGLLPIYMQPPDE